MFKARTLALILLPIASICASQPAHAGVYADDLTRCLVSGTSDDDKISLAKWIFTVMAAHPAAASMAAVSEEDRVEVARTTAGLFEVLLTQRCREQTVSAHRYEGQAAIDKSFEVLGQMAMTTLMEDPKVAAETQHFTSYLDATKFKGMFAKP